MFRSKRTAGYQARIRQGSDTRASRRSRGATTALASAMALAVQLATMQAVLADNAAPALRLYMDDGANAGPLIDTTLPAGQAPDALGCRGPIDSIALGDYNSRYPLTNFGHVGAQAASYFYFDGGGATPEHRFTVQAQDPDGIRSIRVRVITSKTHMGPDGTATRLEQPVTYANVSAADAYVSVLPMYWTGSTGVTHLHDETVLTWNPPAVRLGGEPRELHFEIPSALGLTGTLTVEATDRTGNTATGYTRFIAVAACYD